MRESARIAHKPAGMSIDEAAAVCDGGLNALGYWHRICWHRLFSCET